MESSRIWDSVVVLLKIREFWLYSSPVNSLRTCSGHSIIVSDFKKTKLHLFIFCVKKSRDIEDDVLCFKKYAKLSNQKY